MAYVYRHIRVDKNLPFYIGIGSDESYKRAFWKHGRTKYWRNVVKKSAYQVEIILDDLSWEEACKKEKEFISLYGKSYNGTGTLVNLTDGGDGVIGIKPNMTPERNKKISETLKRKYSTGERISATKGIKPSDETREKLSKTSLGRKHSDETKKKLSIIKIGNTANLGNKLSNETKIKIGKKHIGKKLSNEHRFKLSESHKGYQPSEEQKKKISASLKGLKRSEETKARMSQAQKKRFSNPII